VSTDLVVNKEHCWFCRTGRVWQGRGLGGDFKIRRRHGGSRDMEKDLKSVHDLDGTKNIESMILANAKISRQLQ
jgi:hypothetical protein